MGILTVILTLIHVVVSILLVVVILMQASKGGGLSGTFGGQASTAIFGARGTATVLSTATQYLAGAFLVLSFTLSMLAGTGQVPQSVTQKVLQTSPASQLPPVEALDFGTSTPPQGEEAGDGEEPVVPGE